MEIKQTNLYHVHRRGINDDLWRVGNEIVIDDNFNTLLYNMVLEIESELVNRYGDYDIDYIIATMEEMKYKNLVEDDMKDDFNLWLKRYYFFRREKSLEEGRKIFNPSAPSRFHSLYLTDFFNLKYWINCVGDNNFDIFLLYLKGNFFIGSDTNFPNSSLTFDNQVEQSQLYWKPKQLSIYRHKEILFQGIGKIVK